MSRTDAETVVPAGQGAAVSTAHSPAAYMLGVAALCVIVLVSTLWTALAQPWLGITLAQGQKGIPAIVAVEDGGPVAASALDHQLLSVAGPIGRGVALVNDDLTEEADFLGSYDALRQFFARQDQLAGILAAGGPVRLTLDNGTVIEAMPGARPLGTLPVAFWVQYLTGAGALLIAGWVWAIRPRDAAPRIFLLSGLCMIASTHAAAIYSTRELAIDGTLFRFLSCLNFGGSLGFGGAAIALFLLYPKALVPIRQLLWLPVALALVMVLDIAQVLHSVSLVHYVPTAFEMALIVVLVGVQWRVNRGDPTARAALAWLGLTIIVGAGCFILIIAAPLLIDRQPSMSQGHAFGFFLAVYIGLALGLRRYRLFEIGEWSFRVLFYGGAVLAMLLLDAGMLYVLHLRPEPSMGLALIAVGFLYLPFRDAAWRRVVARRRMSESELFGAAAAVAFTASAVERAGRWQALLRRLFDPLEVVALEHFAGPVRVGRDGTELLLPPTAGAPALALRYPWGGRALFGPAHLDLARQLTDLVGHADRSRDAYDRGAAAERQRISRDLHDDVGARLLAGLHKPDVAQVRKILREAIADVRTIASALAGDRLPLATVLADLRHETAERLEAAGVALDWPPAADDDGPMLDYVLYHNLVSALREIFSNVIRHAHATRVRVALDLCPDRLDVEVSDDGVGLPAGARPRGNGLANIAQRLREAGGRLEFPAVERGLAVRLVVPLKGAGGRA
ncbi:sensor histidine kinase [Zavarzinia sp.]|uniref:sensor histidine kinase n=1 Tax=Zavarzinia sp. TaxID=2027920 RepID=UPI0035689336